MEAKEILTRLEIVKLATTIGDNDTIIMQCSFLQNSDNKRIDEIILLLKGKNYRQALYLIKGFIADLGSDTTVEQYEESDEEQILDVEDMLRMSPLAKDTIKNYQKNNYTNDDLEAFAKNIEKPISDEYKNVKSVEVDIKEEDSSIDNEVDIDKSSKEKIETKVDNDELDNNNIDNKSTISNEISNELDIADSNTPLDEISSKKIDSNKKNRKSTLSKYKKLREKFSKKSRLKNKNENESNKKVKVEKVDLEKSTNNEKEKNSKNDLNSVEDNTIYSPIPHIEQKFIQSFVLYSPKKESGIWVEEVVIFLKKVSKDSFTESDVKFFLNEFDFYLSKNEVSKASQVLLLASATDSKYAQFLLARELFSGKILIRDLKKSFTIMKNLANQFYPEAVCDLGQFYEHGIGVTKDRKVAIKLYEKAFELGVARATKHINRLKESNSFLSTIFKLK